MPDDTQNNTSTNLASNPTSEITGTPAEGMDLDPRHKAITKELEQKWLQQNPGKDLLSYDGQNYVYGRQDGQRTRTLTSDAETLFQQRYPQDADAYRIKEGARIYDSPASDPAIKRLEKDILQRTNTDRQLQNSTRSTGNDSYGNVWNRVNTRENLHGWDRFTSQYPEKAKAYAERGHEDLKKALERRVEIIASSHQEKEQQNKRQQELNARITAEQQRLLREHTERLNTIGDKTDNLQVAQGISSQIEQPLVNSASVKIPVQETIITPTVSQETNISIIKTPTSNIIRTTNNPPGTAIKNINTLPANKNNSKNKKDYSHAIKTLTDESFWASLLTILAIPVLLLMALFDIILKAAPWATGPS